MGAAIAVIDEAGLDALSMRRLGRELGVDPMALYHHVPGKEALLREAVREVFARMAIPAREGPWQEQVRAWARAYRDVARRHPNLVIQIVSEPEAVAVAAVRANEALYGALEGSGLPAEAVVPAAGLVVDFVNGFMLAFAGSSDGGAGADPLAEARAAFLAELDAQPPDHVAAQRRVLAAAEVARDVDHFELGLDVIVAGLDAIAARG